MSRRTGLGPLALAALLLAGCGSASSASAGIAASVNDHPISMSSYSTQLKMDEIAFSDANGYNPCGISSLKPVCSQLKNKSLSTVIGREYVRQYASRHHIVLTNTEIQRNWNIIFQKRFMGNAAALRAWTRRTGISVAALKASLASDQLEQKVLFAVTQNASTHAPAIQIGRLVAATRSQLKTIQTLRRTESFDQVAFYMKRVAHGGCAAVKCGNLGWIPYPLLPPDGKKLEKLPVGSVIGPVTVQQGWELLQVTGRDQHYALTSTQLYALRTQLFKKWLGQQVARARVKRYVAV